RGPPQTSSRCACGQAQRVRRNWRAAVPVDLDLWRLLRPRSPGDAGAVVPGHRSGPGDPRQGLQSGRVRGTVLVLLPLHRRARGAAGRTGGRLDDLFVPLLGRGLRVTLPVVAVIFALPILVLPPAYAGVAAKG